MTNKGIVTSKIIAKYTIFLYDGFTIDGKQILVGTICSCLHAVHIHHKDKGFIEPFGNDSDSDAVQLLREQAKFEDEPSKRSPLMDQMMVKMWELAQDDSLGFRAAAWDFTNLGKYERFREQEFAMESRNKLRYYVLPDGTKVVRTFTVKYFIMYNKAGVIIEKPLDGPRALCEKLETEYDVQKNGTNKQIILVVRVNAFPDFDPLESGYDVIERATALGSIDPEDPLCVYKGENGVQCLTGTDITVYYRFIMQLVNHTHSIRIFACVLLHEAGKYGPYIKLRLRWLSNCFEIYLRNTDRITNQHNKLLHEVHQCMQERAISASN